MKSQRLQDQKRSTPAPVGLSSKKKYQNPAPPAARRVKDLLKRMPLAEKAAQMMCVWQEKATKLVDAAGNFEQSYL